MEANDAVYKHHIFNIKTYTKWKGRKNDRNAKSSRRRGVWLCCSRRGFPTKASSEMQGGPGHREIPPP